jgi:hypothetical protein
MSLDSLLSVEPVVLAPHQDQKEEDEWEEENEDEEERIRMGKRSR